MLPSSRFASRISLIPTPLGTDNDQPLRAMCRPSRSDVYLLQIRSAAGALVILRLLLTTHVFALLYEYVYPPKDPILSCLIIRLGLTYQTTGCIPNGISDTTAILYAVQADGNSLQ